VRIVVDSVDVPVAAVTRMTSTSTDAGLAGGAFVINLSTTRNEPLVTSAASGITNKQLYVSSIQVGKTEWQQLRLGFFTSEGRAEAVLADMQQSYPDALIVRVDADEFQRAAENPVSYEEPAAEMPIQNIPVASQSLSDSQLEELMARARNEMLAENYPTAIRLYTKILREGETRYAPDALEYLGLARERNGQEAHAAAEYRRYLANYAGTGGAPRVQQRLDALVLPGASDAEPSVLAPVFAGNEDSRQRTSRVAGEILQPINRDVHANLRPVGQGLIDRHHRHSTHGFIGSVALVVAP
jgi:hypothetical protein